MVVGHLQRDVTEICGVGDAGPHPGYRRAEAQLKEGLFQEGKSRLVYSHHSLRNSRVTDGTEDRILTPVARDISKCRPHERAQPFHRIRHGRKSFDDVLGRTNFPPLKSRFE